ncbi:MAG: type II toxin-antitoxin system HicB family antitoxin [Verrucomicrobiales bacterium]|jgi:predicted RNase H-like HicB family nuclease|nr:type II toxin-antitoxin system HicB family antitoxin [Verrucomicrobiales bacterium]
MKYLTKIYWSEADEAFIAEVPALRGCVSHGATREEAAANIEEAMTSWLGSAQKHGDPIPAPDLATEEITRLSPLLNVSKLARLTGLNKHTLASKLRRHSPFTVQEAKKILAVVRMF